MSKKLNLICSACDRSYKGKNKCPGPAMVYHSFSQGFNSEFIETVDPQGYCFDATPNLGFYIQPVKKFAPK